MKNDKDENQDKSDDFECPIQQFEKDNEGDELYISHSLTTMRGEIFYAYKSLELEEVLPDGEVETIIAIDALNYPEKGDRSIVMVPKSHIDYTQEPYHEGSWDELMRAAFCSQCEHRTKYSDGKHAYGIYQ